MKFSDFFHAIQSGSPDQANKLIARMRKLLLSYLKVQYNVNDSDAEDCIQQAFANTIESIKKDKIDNPEAIYSYLLTSARNHYFKLDNKQKTQVEYNEEALSAVRTPNPFYHLLEEEKYKQLKKCFSQLNERYQSYLIQFFRHPDCQARELADKLGISVNNTWIRRHRAVKTLQQCVRRNISAEAADHPAVRKLLKLISDRLAKPAAENTPLNVSS